MGDQFIGSEVLAGLGLMVVSLAFFALPLGGSGVHGQHEILSGFVSGVLHRLQDMFNRILVALQVGGEAAFIADGGGFAFRLQQLLQGVENLRAHPQSFAERGSARGHNHEFLRIHGVGGMRAAVEDVHHGNRQVVALHAAQELVQRYAQAFRRRLRGSDGNRQNRVGAQLGFVFRSVRLQHGAVHSVGVPGVDALEHVVDHGIHIVHSLGNALAAETALVAVPQLQRFKLTGGSAGRSRAASDDPAGKRHLRLHGGIAAGVDNFTSCNLGNGKAVHVLSSFPAGLNHGKKPGAREEAEADPDARPRYSRSRRIPDIWWKRSSSGKNTIIR